MDLPNYGQLGILTPQLSKRVGEVPCSLSEGKWGKKKQKEPSLRFDPLHAIYSITASQKQSLDTMQK